MQRVCLTGEGYNDAKVAISYRYRFHPILSLALDQYYCRELSSTTTSKTFASFRILFGTSTLLATQQQTVSALMCPIRLM